MGFIKDKFFGGDIEEASRRQQTATKEAGVLRGAAFEEAAGKLAPAIRAAAQTRVGGLQGAGARLTEGAGLSFEEIERARGGLAGDFDPFITGGQDAFRRQLAQSGALGPEEQQAFFDEFSTSPGTQFQLEQARRFVESGGGIGGGNRLRRLQEVGLGLIQQDLDTRFNQLGTLAGRGLTAASSRAPLSADLTGKALDVRGGLTGGLASLDVDIANALASGELGGTEAEIQGILGKAGIESSTLQNVAALRAAGILGASTQQKLAGGEEVIGAFGSLFGGGGGSTGGGGSGLEFAGDESSFGSSLVSAGGSSGTGGASLINRKRSNISAGGSSGTGGARIGG